MTHESKDGPMQTVSAADRVQAGQTAAMPRASAAGKPRPMSGIGVTTRMRVVFLLLFALPPGVALYLLENDMVASPGRMLGLWLAGALVLTLPLSRLAARFVVLGDVAAINAFCAALRRGEYQRRLPLPPQGDDEHELLRLKRDLNWLAHGVETRETWLSALLDETKRRERHFADLSRTDGLTGLFNRRHFDATLPELAEEAASCGHSLWLAFLDCDAFKGVNDRFGHPAGDAVLAGMGKTLLDSTREGLDMPFRLGGDEFAVLLTRLPVEAALAVAERIRRRFAACQEYGVTASIGLARFDPRQDARPYAASLAARCDAALYAAKAGGGDAVSVAPGDDAPAPQAPGKGR